MAEQGFPGTAVAKSFNTGNQQTALRTKRRPDIKKYQQGKPCEEGEKPGFGKMNI